MPFFLPTLSFIVRSSSIKNGKSSELEERNKDEKGVGRRDAEMKDGEKGSRDDREIEIKKKDSKSTGENLVLERIMELDILSQVDGNARLLSVEELLSEYITLKVKFCARLIIASSVFLILPLVFDCTLLTETVDYTKWHCLDTASGICSDATTGGAIYNREIFCNLNPVDSLPSDLYTTPVYNNETNSFTLLTNENMEDYFVRDVNFSWDEEVSTRFPVMWSLYCDNEKTTHVNVIWIGMVISGVVSGFVVDQFGRRAPLISTGLIGSLLFLVLTFTEEYHGFLVIRILHGILYTTYAISSIIWVCEALPRISRTFALLIIAGMTALGRILLVVMTTELTKWKDVVVVIMFLCWLTGISIVLLPESVQFLLSHHLDQEAGRALSKISSRWNIYSSILKLTTTTDISHRDNDHFTALFTSRQIATRVIILIFLWGTSLLPLTSRVPTEGDMSVPLYYTIQTFVTLAVELVVVGGMWGTCNFNCYIPERTFLSLLLLFNALLNILSIGYTTMVLSVGVQAVTETCALLVVLLSVELVPMPQRGAVMGIGYTLRGAAALINIRFYNIGGGGEGLWIRSIIAVLLLIGSCVAYLLPAVKHNAHKLPFSVGLSNRKTVVISEKKVLTTTPPNRQTSSKPEVLDTQLGDVQQKNLKYILIEEESPVNRYIFLDKNRRQLDIQIERGAKSITDGVDDVSCDASRDTSLVIVNVYRDNLLLKSYQQRSPTLIIDCSPTASLINDVSVIESGEIRKIFGNAMQEGEEPKSTAARIVHHSSADIVELPNMALARPTSSTPSTAVESGETFEVVTVQTSWSEANTMEFTDTESCISSDARPAGVLRKFNTHMNLQSVEVHPRSDAEPFEKAERWRNKMSSLEFKYEGENQEYLRYESPDIIPVSKTTPPTVTSSENNATESPPESTADSTIEYMRGLRNLLDDDGDSPIYAFFPLALSLDQHGNMEQFIFGSESSGDNQTPTGQDTLHIL